MEERKDIVGYDGLYQISSLGRISSRWFGKRRILKQGFRKSGYLSIGLHKNGDVKTFYVHRLVAENRINNPLNKVEVNHKDGNKHNNTITNLEWSTKSENMTHSFRVLGRPSPMSMLGKEGFNKNKYGKDNHKSKKIGQYTKDGEIVNIRYGSGDIHRTLGHNEGLINMCRRGIRKQAYGFIWVNI